MSVLRDLMQSMFMQQQGGGNLPPPQVGANMSPPAPKPRTPSPSPLSAGARSAMEAVNRSQSPREAPSFGSRLFDTVGRTLSNVSLSQLRTSPVPSARMVGGMMRTIDEQEAEDERLRRERDKHELEQLKYFFKQDEAQRKSLLQEGNLAERMRHNRAIEMIKASMAGSGGGRGIGSGRLSIKSEDRLRMIGTARKQLNSIEKTFNALKSKSEGNIFTPFGAMPGANSFKGMISRRAGSAFPEILKEHVLTSRLHSKAKRIQALLEGIETGKTPGEQLMKKFDKELIYIDLRQPKEVIEDRIKDIHNELNNTEKSILRGSSPISEILDEDTDDDDVTVSEKRDPPALSHKEIEKAAEEEALRRIAAGE